MCLSVFLDLEHRPHKPLNHGFVINKAFPTLSGGLIVARLNVGFVVRVVWLHSKITNISSEIESHIIRHINNH